MILILVLLPSVLMISWNIYVYSNLRIPAYTCLCIGRPYILSMKIYNVYVSSRLIMNMMMCKAYLVIITGWKNKKVKYPLYDWDSVSEFWMISCGHNSIITLNCYKHHEIQYALVESCYLILTLSTMSYFDFLT